MVIYLITAAVLIIVAILDTILDTVVELGQAQRIGILLLHTVAIGVNHILVVDERKPLLLCFVLLEKDLEVGVVVLALLGNYLHDLVLERIVLHHLLMEVAALPQIGQLADSTDLIEDLAHN